MRLLDELERHVSSWPEVSAHPHRFGGREFRFRAAEIGPYLHTGPRSKPNLVTREPSN